MLHDVGSMSALSYVRWPCHMFCVPVPCFVCPCSMALSNVPWPSPMSHGRVPCRMRVQIKDCGSKQFPSMLTQTGQSAQSRDHRQSSKRTLTLPICCQAPRRNDLDQAYRSHFGSLLRLVGYHARLRRYAHKPVTVGAWRQSQRLKTAMATACSHETVPTAPWLACPQRRPRKPSRPA